MFALIHSLLRRIRWTLVSAVLLDSRLALEALWGLPLLLLRHSKTVIVSTTMMMMRMEMLALPALTRCLLDTLTLCYSWQKRGVVLVIRVVILKGRVSIKDFVRGKVHIEGCSEDLMYFFFLFFLFEIHYSCTWVLWLLLTYIVLIFLI